MEYTYDPRVYPYINDYADSGNWSMQTAYMNTKQSQYQHIQLQAYTTYPNNFATEWAYFNDDRNHRYMSPSDTYSSSRSEVSTPHDHSSAASVTQYPLVYSPCAVETVNPLLFEPVAKQMNNNREFSLPEQDNPAYMPFDTHHHTFPFVSQNQPIKELDFFQQDEEERDEEAIPVHPSHITQQICPPQEVEFPTETTSTPMDESTPQRKRNWHSDTDEEQDAGDENVATDDIADSDYLDKPKPKRRKSSITRAPKQAGCKRTTSNVTSPKKTTQTLSPTTVPKDPAPIRHKRQPSKQGKKLPKFAIKDTQPAPLDKKDRSFPCTFHHFGCQSVFPNKNEWKRHVACQHLQLGFYRCDLDGCNPENTAALHSSRRSSGSSSIKKEVESDERTVIYNDFNRKDLFTQHARRMHGPTRNASLCSTAPTKKGVLVPTKEDELAFEHDLNEIRLRCWMTKRNAPKRSNCGICGRVFDAEYYKDAIGKTHGGGSMSQGPVDKQNAEEKAWEERMEHVGRHYERQDCKNIEEVDEDLVKWGLDVGLMGKLDDGQAWLLGVDLPGETDQQGVKVEEGRKTRRQPSRTVVRQTIKKEEEVDDVAVTDEEDAPGDSE